MTVLVSVLVGLATGPIWQQLAAGAISRRAVGRCPSCGKASLLRCRACGYPPRIRILGTSALAAVLLGVVPVVAPEWWAVPGFAVAAAASTVLVITDIDAKLIPNRILYPATAATLLWLGVGAVVSGELPSLLRGLASAGVYFSVLLAVAVVAKGGFGMGDVKLAVLLGFVTGFVSLRTFLLGVFFTGVFGGLPAIALLLARRAKPGDELPYGPAMIAGAWTALVFGEGFLRWYQG